MTHDEIRRAVEAALAEDLGAGDATTLSTTPAHAEAVAVMNARVALTVAGLDFAAEAFRQLAEGVEITYLEKDGSKTEGRTDLLRVKGPARGLLSAERVALNFTQRLSGVATLTSEFVDLVEGTRARILDTRKTTPGWRRFEKYAVACGGGSNHRFGLFDMILIKDNHLAALRGATPNPIAAAVQRARDAYPKLKVEVEADTIDQVRQAIDARADYVLLDNMSLDELHTSVELCRGRCLTEASGGVNLQTVRGIAETGVDFISVGALTHSARAVDIGLDFEL